MIQVDQIRPEDQSTKLNDLTHVKMIVINVVCYKSTPSQLFENNCTKRMKNFDKIFHCLSHLTLIMKTKST